ncbi:MAG: diadenylate cyclase CdaA [Coprococcus sp.]|nr:diadenylate cyclase CdaA [Coprococcus sp.]
MEKISTFLSMYFDWFYITVPGVVDIIEILILSFFIYNIMLWFKNSRAWTLLKGIAAIAVFTAIAAVFQFNTILFLLKNAFSVGIIAVVILFQPEFRRGLEQLGRNKIINYIMRDNEDDGVISEKTIYELVKTMQTLSANRTGALVVIENQVALGEYIATGIPIDAVVTNQLLLNIFEHNTPLHDGAVIIRKNRVVSATCYLPLSANDSINKELGTRHRAGIGISEVSDSMTLIVSEETGAISIAMGGELFRNLDSEGVRKQLQTLCKDYNGRRVYRKSNVHPSKKRRKRLVVENKDKASRKEAEADEE